MNWQPVSMLWGLKLIRWCVGGVFIASGALKLGSLQSFTDAIFLFDIVPVVLVNVIALILPGLELIMGLLLVSGLASRLSAASVAAMSLVFSLVLLHAIVSGKTIECGCFGKAFGKGDTLSDVFARDIVLLLASICLLYFAKSGSSFSRHR